MTPPIPSKAAIELFAAFSRFEFALKEGGYAMADRWSGAAANWSAFGRVPAVEKAFEAIRAAPQLEILLVDPPRKQVVVGGRLEWGDAPTVTDAASLLAALRRVRNNLFHGGKSGADPRDDELCTATVFALLALVKADVQVQAAFEGRY